MTLEEARKIRECNGLGYSTIEFIMALRTIEDHLDSLKESKTPEGKEE